MKTLLKILAVILVLGAAGVGDGDAGVGVKHRQFSTTQRHRRGIAFFQIIHRDQILPELFPGHQRSAGVASILGFSPVSCAKMSIWAPQ